MARNWDSASRGGLGSLVDSYYSGKKIAQDEQDRARNWGSKRLEMDQEARNKYRTVKYDANGVPLEAVEDLDAIQRDQGPNEALTPHFFRRDPQPTLTQDKSQAAPQQETDEQFLNRMREKNNAAFGVKTPQQGTQTPQDNGEPAPLLRDPKVEQAAAQAAVQNQQASRDSDLKEKEIAAKAAKTPPVEEVAPGLKAQIAPGNKIIPGQTVEEGTVSPVRTEVQGEGMDVTAAPPSSPAPSPREGVEPIERFNPTPEMRRRIMELNTSSVQRDADPMVDISTLPAPIQAALGTTQGRVRASLLKTFLDKSLEGTKAAEEAKSKSIDQRAYDLIDTVLKGELTPGAALRNFQAAVGRQANKAEFDAIMGANRTGDVQGRFDKNVENSMKRARSAVIRNVGTNMMTNFKGEIDEIQSALTLKKMLSQKNTAGLEHTLAILMNRMSGQAGNSISNRDLEGAAGVTGWEARMDQAMAKIAGEGLTPQNKAMLNRLADDFLGASDKVLRTKGNFVFRRGIGELVELGVDPDEAQRILSNAVNVNTLAGEIQGAYGAEGGEAPKNSAPKEDASPTSDENKLRKEMQMATAAMQTVDKNDKLNPSQKRIKKDEIAKQFKKRTGIDWGKAQ